jgi:hypothetical protein
LRATTAGYQLDAARGFVTWTLNLVNGERRNVDLGFARTGPHSPRLSQPDGSLRLI